MSASLQTISFSNKGGASAKLERLGNAVYMVRNVWANKKQEGHGTAIMQEVTAYADAHMLTLVLTAQGYGKANEIMDNSKLVEFYSRFGFTPQSVRKPVRMIRHPLGKV
jgi:hypothetical protein